MEYAWAFWLILAVVLIVVEASTYNLISIWFALGALAAVIPALISGDAVWVQFAVFVIVSAISLVFTRKFFKNVIRYNPEPTNADQVIGKTAVVKEEIDNIHETGKVTVMGLDWSARSVDDSVIAVGEVVTVKEISGVKLIVEKTKTEE